jgi:putative ABC transport system permease protein
MKEQNRLWRLIARKMSGEASEEDLQELQKLIRDNPDLGFYIQIITDYWKKRKSATVEEKTDELLKRIRNRIELENRTGPSIKPSKTPHLDLSWKPGTRKPVGRLRSFARKGGMLVNYFKITWRVVVRNKTFSFINIGGLAIGMATAILILLLIQDQLSFDQFHSKKDRLYLLYNLGKINDNVEAWPVTPVAMAPTIKSEYPEVEEVTRMNWVAVFILKYGDKQIQTDGFMADPGFLTMFDFPLLKGNAATALNGPRNIVVTQSLAKKMFGTEDALGKVIKIDSNALFTVTGVLKDYPSNTRFRGEYLLPFSYMKELGWDKNTWTESSVLFTYILLKPGVTEEQANQRLRDIYKKHTNEVSHEVFAHPIRKWHLWSRFENGKVAGGAIEEVRMFSIIAGFILLIACINYMNLSTARSVKRAREVGIRKVVGAGKGSLVGQFLWESILFSFIAGIIALIILSACLGWFNQFFDSKLFIPLANPYFWLYGIGFVLFTGMLAGSYPAFYLSAYKPIRVLKGIFKGSHTLVTPRKVLVVLQFSFAIALIICTIVIYRQLAYGLDRDLGYAKENLAFVYVKGDMLKNYEPIRRELLRSGAITDIMRTNSPITEIWSTDNRYEWDNKNSNVKYEFIRFNVERDFTKTLHLPITAGRDLNVDSYPTDSTAIIINETAAKLLNFPDPLGQTIRVDTQTWHIVGVTKDFITGWPYQPYVPTVVQGPGYGNWFGAISFRLNERNSTSANLAKITAIFKKHNPDYPFEHHFVDEAFKEKLTGVKFMGTLASLFAGLTILISCLGLFALATFMAENRIKEVGVRKVLGASAMRITTLLSADFIKLIVISFAIASPVAWWAMNAWLKEFSYKVSISWWIFALTGLISVVIAAATISYQSIKAALANPVNSLRSE